MLINHGKIIATIMLSALAATSAIAADSAENALASIDGARPETAAVNRDLARRATRAAIEDAIDAVLSANRQHLDFRMNGRTSTKASEESTDGR